MRQRPATRKRRALPKAVPSLEPLELRAVPAVLASPFPSNPAEQFPTIQLPPGFQIEKVVDGLTYPTSITWDDQGQMFVAEAGGGFLDEPAPARILRIEPGRATEVVNLEDRVGPSVVGLTFHDGAFFITHRDPANRTGAVSRVTPDGAVTQILGGIIDSQSEHQINDIRVGPDGRMFVTVGPAFNSAVAGIDNAPWLALSPGVRTTPGQDIVLTGVNYLTPDFRTAENQSDTALTGAFVPFGTPTSPGQVIPGTNKPGGSILVFDPNNAEATVRPFAWGFRNIIGIAWNSRDEMFAAVNGYDVRGSRPVNDKFDPIYRVREGAWYGWPDFSAALEPLTDPKFDSPDSLQAAKFLNGQPLPKDRLHFVIDHAASGLTPPDPSLILGLEPVNASPSLLDVAPASWGRLVDQVFVADWGDLAPPTNPLRDMPVGSTISRIDPITGQTVPFIRNAKPGPASEQGAPGQGIERPFDVKFGPDGAMYIVDYGVARPNRADAGPGDDPYEFPPETGIIWRVTRTATAPDAGLTPNQRFVAQLFRDLLRREVDPVGLGGFSDLLDRGAATPRDVVGRIMESPEFRTEVVQGLYRQFLGRPADPIGLNDGVDFLSRGGTTEQLAAFILGSEEYFNTRGARFSSGDVSGRGTDEGFLQALYHDVLFRAIDGFGAQEFGRALSSGVPRQQVAAAVLASQESNVTEVRTLFSQLLGRDADGVGRSGFVDSLQRGVPNEQIIAIIASSPEFVANAGGILGSGGRTSNQALVADPVGIAGRARNAPGQRFASGIHRDLLDRGTASRRQVPGTLLDSPEFQANVAARPRLADRWARLLGLRRLG